MNELEAYLRLCAEYDAHYRRIRAEDAVNDVLWDVSRLFDAALNDVAVDLLSGGS